MNFSHQETRGVMGVGIGMHTSPLALCDVCPLRQRERDPALFCQFFLQQKLSGRRRGDSACHWLRVCEHINTAAFWTAHCYRRITANATKSKENCEAFSEADISKVEQRGNAHYSGAGATDSKRLHAGSSSSAVCLRQTIEIATETVRTAFMERIL
jgi:hypothetical protein